MMKKSRSLIKVVACLAASFTLVVGNPLMAEARGTCSYRHSFNNIRIIHATTCKSKDIWVFECTDCGETSSTTGLYGPHCYPTDPYKAPICIYCGHRR